MKRKVYEAVVRLKALFHKNVQVLNNKPENCSVVMLTKIETRAHTHKINTFMQTKKLKKKSFSPFRRVL
jgi:hypothetical protein